MKIINNIVIPILDEERRKVWDVCKQLDPYSGLLTIKEEIERALELSDSGMWSDLQIEVSENEYDQNWYVMGYRDETDKEQKDRIKLENKIKKNKLLEKEKKEKREKKEYERLKRKFEKGK